MAPTMKKINSLHIKPDYLRFFIKILYIPYINCTARIMNASFNVAVRIVIITIYIDLGEVAIYYYL